MPKSELVRLIKRLSVLMNQRIDDVLKIHGMARSQFQVLYFINKSISLPQKDLLESLAVEPATLSGLIDTLENKGLVKRSVLASDKRSKNIELTKLGKKTIASIPHPGLIIENIMFKDVKESDKNNFKKTIIKVIENLEVSELTK
jgi:DNA-binding MarR family transcriptional regulator